MGLVRRFYDNVKQNYRERGLRGLKDTVTLGTTIVKERAKEQAIDSTRGRRARRGAQNIYERDWDVLVLLDCARIDMMEQIKDEYDFVTDVGEHKSVGGHSREWMEYTFTDEYEGEMSRTLHVTANTASNRVLDPDDFLHLEEVWRDGWDSEYNTIVPQTVTDRAIALHRELSPDRTIIHYMQPHTPFIPFPDVAASQVTGPGIEGDYGKGIAELAKEYGREQLWEFHVENLRYVLDNLELLLSNIEAERVVISADHGQALGENGEWGHNRGTTLDCVRKVPWSVTSAVDSGDYDPDYDIHDDSTQEPDLSVEEKLKYLGYKPGE